MTTLIHGHWLQGSLRFVGRMLDDTRWIADEIGNIAGRSMKPQWVSAPLA
jgi:hypothetical protein